MTTFKHDLVVLESCHQTYMTYTSADCTVEKLLMMSRGTARNMQSFLTEINFGN